MCGEQVADKYLMYKDLPICEKDFRRVGHVCSVCDEVILDRVCMVEGVVMCEKDYMELISTWPCAACGKEIPTGDTLTSMIFLTIESSVKSLQDDRISYIKLPLWGVWLFINRYSEVLNTSRPWPDVFQSCISHFYTSHAPMTIYWEIAIFINTVQIMVFVHSVYQAAYGIKPSMAQLYAALHMMDALWPPDVRLIFILTLLLLS